MSYYDDEDDIKTADDWWAENGDKVDPVIEDEIDGENVISIEDLDEDDEPTYNPYEDDDDDSDDDNDDNDDGDDEDND